MDDLAVPQLSGYTVGRCLGRGGSSTVWLVTEERTGRKFALKCLRTRPGKEGGPGDGSGAEALRREIRILSALDHPHLIRAHDAVRVAGGAGAPDSPEGAGTTSSAVTAEGLGLLVEYASGGSLGQLVASRGRLSIGETVTVLTPIAQVLGYLHGQGVTHSDVSPGNVLFTGHGKPVLADVGISRLVGDALAVPDDGTAGFVDPSPVDTVRAGLQPERDVYAVAALGWYCLTGEPPGRTLDRPPLSLLRPEVPGDLAAALEAGLNEDRRLRPTAVELAAAVYRSAPPLPVDLAGSVHPTVIPELLTRRRPPERSGGAVRGSLEAWRRRISTSQWSGLLRAPQVMPFPLDPFPVDGFPLDPYPVDRKTQAPPEPGERTGARRVQGKHAGRAPRATEPRRGGGRGRETAGLAAGAVTVIAVATWAAGAIGPAGPWPATSWEGTGGQEQARAAADAGTDSRPDPGIPDQVNARIASGDPAEAVQGLAWIRSYAFSSGRTALLDQVNAPGSPAAAADERIAARLRESGHVLAGFTSTLSNVVVRPERPPGGAVVAVTSATSSYQELDQVGNVVASGPPGEGQELRLVLVRYDGRWRITEILAGR